MEEEPTRTEEESLAEEETQDVEAVFLLLDPQGIGISQQGLEQVVKATGLVSDREAERQAADAAQEGQALALDVFRACVTNCLHSAAERIYEQTSFKSGSPNSSVTPTMGTALLGVLEFIRKRADEVEDYRTAWAAKEMSNSLTSREETRRLQRMSERQKLEQDGVQEAHMMQAMEFNSAWSANMTEFERQAQEIEDQIKDRQREEFNTFQTQLREQGPRTYKFSRELLQLRKSIGALAKQSKYEKAHEISQKADQLERYERMKLDNEYKVHIASKELQLRQQQQLQLEALRRRIQRGREEHKEHWLLGAQRLMQSHRNMLSDLRTKQALENTRADTAVKMDLAASRASTNARRAKNHFSDARPRVDTWRQKGGGVKR